MTHEDERLETDSRLKRYAGIADMIGDRDNPTPIVALNKTLPEGSAAQLFVKLEWLNPFGSVKDRPAKWMLAAMEERIGLADKTVIEPTSGNTGIALAGMCALLGHPMVATVPYTTPEEKILLLKALGATVVTTPADPLSGKHPMDVSIEMAEAKVAEAAGTYVMPNQYDNPDNIAAHYDTTGPEIWDQTDGKVRYFFAGFGTCGTLIGVGRYLKERNPEVQVIGIEPVVGHHISGLKNFEETAVPGIYDPSVIDEIVYVNDAETAEMSRRLHAEEAMLIGSSGAAILAGAVRYLEGREGIGVAIAPDSSQKAISYLAAMLDE